MTSRGALGLLLLLALAACSNNGGGSAVTLPPSGPASYKIGEAQNYTVIAATRSTASPSSSTCRSRP
jgi:hypothetical protein